MIDWLPGFERVDGTGSGDWAADDEDAPKIVWHTTEGGSVDGAIAALRAKSAWSHFVVDPKTKRKVQCVPLSQAAKALRHPGGTPQTNREKRVYQIEMVGYAAHTQELTADELKWLGEEVLAPLSVATGTPLVKTGGFYGQDCGWTLASVNSKSRMSRATFDKAVGNIGHQDVPDNDHWDPGKLDIDAIIAAAKAKITSAVASVKPKFDPPHYPGHFLKLGDDNEDVKVLKVMLKVAGYGKLLNMRGSAASKFGPGTARAVKKLQADYYKATGKAGKPDGIVGPLTWNWLRLLLFNLHKK